MDQLTDSECLDFLRSLFPEGVKNAAVISELCPDGWEQSHLFACFHPGPERLFEEHRNLCRNFRRLSEHRKQADPTNETMPSDECATLEEYLVKYPPEAVALSSEAEMDEPAELIGLCMWDVFSDNHDVIAADGRVVDLGSFRGSGGMIADFFDTAPWTSNGSEEPWSAWDRSDYMRFYMGTCWIAGRADLTPVYRLIFRRIQSVHADWRYSFPRLHVVDFGAVRSTDAPGDYDPSKAFAEEQNEQERAARTRRLQRELDDSATRAMREARSKEPPETVQAYQSVFGRFPAGWPPDPYGD